MSNIKISGNVYNGVSTIKVKNADDESKLVSFYESASSSDVTIQDDKSVTITSNGTTTITPDAPYDAMSKVDVTVNAGGSRNENIVSFVYTPSDGPLTISNALLIENGITSVDKFYSITGISIIPLYPTTTTGANIYKGCVGYGSLTKGNFMQALPSWQGTTPFFLLP